jgi:hypothetical protein
MWLKALLSRLDKSSWWPFPAPPPSSTAKLKKWRYRKVSVIMLIGDWDEDQAQKMAHVTRWAVPLAERLSPNWPPR